MPVGMDRGSSYGNAVNKAGGNFLSWGSDGHDRLFSGWRIRDHSAEQLVSCSADHGLYALMAFMAIVKYRQPQLQAQRQQSGGKAKEQGRDHHHIVAGDIMLQHDIQHGSGK